MQLTTLHRHIQSLPSRRYLLWGLGLLLGLLVSLFLANQVGIAHAAPGLQCGNGTCDPGESFVTCAAACPLVAVPAFVIGDGVCSESSGENFSNSPADCPLQPLPGYVVGDGICSAVAGETHDNSPADCPAPQPQPTDTLQPTSSTGDVAPSPPPPPR